MVYTESMTTCANCGGSGLVDSGGFTPWGAPIDLPCPECTGKWDDLVIIGASWRKDSSLEKWFPATAEELKALREQVAGLTVGSEDRRPNLPRINPEYLALVEKELAETREHRDGWLWSYSLVCSILERRPGWQSATEEYQFPDGTRELIAARLAKQANETIDLLRKMAGPPAVY